MEPKFPTINDVGRKFPGSAVLGSPPLAEDIYAFPIPVELFEDVHQDDFWQVSVRMFGSQLLKMRESTVGCKATGRLATRHGDVDIRKRVIDRRQAATRWEELLLLATLPPPERQEAELRERILKTRIAIEEYWWSDRTLQGGIENILRGFPQMQDLLNTNPGNPTLSNSQLIFVIEDQLQLLSTAAESHVKLVREFVSNSDWDNYRLNRNYQLASLNRNMRVFNTRIRRLLSSTIGNDPNFSDHDKMNIIGITDGRINTNERNLEHARLLVFNPDEPLTRDTEDGEEFAELVRVKSLYDQGDMGFLEGATRLYETSGISVRTISAAPLSHTIS